MNAFAASTVYRKASGLRVKKQVAAKSESPIDDRRKGGLTK